MTLSNPPGAEEARPSLVRWGYYGWDQEYQFGVEVYADHLVWLYDIEGGRGGPGFEPARVRQEMRDFLAKGPPWQWDQFAAEHLQEEYPQQAIGYYWSLALDKIDRALRDPTHDSRSWSAHLDSVAHIHCRIAGDVEGWRARVAELRGLDPAPEGFQERLTEIDVRHARPR